MKLPNYEQAIIPERKIRDYLLSFTHREGRSKAAYFASFGFSASAWEVFAEAPRRHASEHDVVETEETPFGTSLVVEGVLSAADGRRPMVRVVWFVATGETNPRLVTAYPLKGGD